MGITDGVYIRMFSSKVAFKSKLIYLINKSSFLGALLRLYPLAREIRNKYNFGSNAPKYAEPIFLKHQEIEYVLSIGGQIKTSGKVVKNIEPAPLVFFENTEIFRICFRRWVQGYSWEQAGAYKRMMTLISKYGCYDGCSTFKEVERRYARLDELFEKALQEGILQTDSLFRYENGILIHYDGERFFFGGNGNHRLAIAKLAKVDSLKCQLGTVTENGLDTIQKYRNPRG